MKKRLFLLISLFLLIPAFVFSASLDVTRLAGRILLQVESHGEAWYVNPANLTRYYLGKPEDAYSIMREQGQGITNANLKKIPVALELLNGQDTDGDKLPDNLEIALGTNPGVINTDSDGFNDYDEVSKNFNPTGAGNQPIDNNFSSKVKGKIFLQVESHGEAWYVNPVNLTRYYLGTAQDAFNVMRALGLGITNADLENITAMTSSYQAPTLEGKIFSLINNERNNNGLKSLVWNEELAQVAREHSQNLADENKALTGIGYTCDYPIIHHEGMVFGLYSGDRLNNHNIYYFSKNGENIALLSAASVKVSLSYNDPLEKEIEQCTIVKQGMDDSFKETLEMLESQADKINLVNSEITKRKNAFDSAHAVEVVEIKWSAIDELAAEAAQGWMNSEGHRRNILDEDFDESGIGVAYINGYMIATQVFIKKADCGYKNGICCQKAGYYPYCYQPLTCINNKCQ